MEPILKYRCGELHDDDYDARHCCEPHISEVYVCSHCNAEYNFDEEAAAECCADVDPEAPSIPTPEELEHHGQLRLCP